jgi:hypothetical protein
MICDCYILLIVEFKIKLAIRRNSHVYSNDPNHCMVKFNVLHRVCPVAESGLERVTPTSVDGFSSDWIVAILADWGIT